MASTARLVYEIAGQEFSTTVGMEPVTIGRTQENGVTLTGVGVSRSHCQISPRGPELILTDLGIGAWLPPSSAPSEINEVARHLLADHAIHQKCRQVAAAIADHAGLDHAVQLVSAAPP